MTDHPNWPVSLPLRWQGQFDSALTRRGQTIWGRSELHWQTQQDDPTPSASSYELRLLVTMETAASDGRLGRRGGANQREQTSTGRLSANGLLPLRLHQKGRTEQATHIERGGPLGTTAIFSNNRPSTALADGAQDRLSVLAQLAGWFAASSPAEREERFAPGARLEVPVVGLAGAGVWQFEVMGRAAVPEAGPAPPRQGLHLAKAPAFEYDSRVDVWLGGETGLALLAWRVTRPNGDGELHLSRP